MARSKYVWLVVFESGKVQFFKAQTLWQILDSDDLIEDVESIIGITKLELANSYGFGNAIDIPFQD
jgi:hypothetical protein